MVARIILKSMPKEKLFFVTFYSIKIYEVKFYRAMVLKKEELLSEQVGKAG